VHNLALMRYAEMNLSVLSWMPHQTVKRIIRNQKDWDAGQI